jgi:hypothetical protein
MSAARVLLLLVLLSVVAVAGCKHSNGGWFHGGSFDTPSSQRQQP